MDDTPISEANMGARIEQLEEMLTAMAGSTIGAHEAKDFSYLENVAQVETSIAVTKVALCALEPRSATVDLNFQRGEGGSKAKICHSFLLLEVDMTLYMNSTPTNDRVVRTEASTSHVAGTETSSGAVM